MKKIILSLAVVTLIFASCTKETTTSSITGNPNVIGFDFSTGKTRASVVTLDSLQKDAGGFGIYATNSATPVEFIANKAYVYDEADTAWKWADEDISWPANATTGYPINFYAYYPVGDANLATSLAADALAEEYTIPASNLQKDLMAANALDVKTRPSSSNVALNFQHILSQVKFAIVAGTGLTVHVQSIAVKNVNSKNTFDYSTLAWATEVATPELANYDYIAVANPTVDVDEGNGTTAEAVAGTNGPLMLLPQANSAATQWDPTADDGTETLGAQPYIEVVYRITETTGGADVVGFTDATKHPKYIELESTVEGYLFVKVGYPLGSDWAKGYSYTYNIYLGTPDASGGYLVAANFAKADGTDSGLPVVVSTAPYDPITPNDPIVDTSKPIGFTVEVSGWTDADAPEILK